MLKHITSLIGAKVRNLKNGEFGPRMKASLKIPAHVVVAVPQMSG